MRWAGVAAVAAQIAGRCGSAFFEFAPAGLLGFSVILAVGIVTTIAAL